MGQLDYSDFNAVRIGPEVVGWVGPTRPDREANTFQSDVIIVMGDKTFRLDVQAFQWGYMETQQPDDFDEIAPVLDMLGYAKRFIVPVPIGSMDVSSLGITYNARSLLTLMAAMRNFSIALTGEVQASLHAMTPVEVVRKFADLVSCNYPDEFARDLVWRGIALNELGQNTTMKVRAAASEPSFGSKTPYTGRWTIQELPRTFSALGSRTPTLFNCLVDWQMRSKYGFDYTAPKNVIHIRANSLEEYELGDNLLGELKILNKYMAERMPDAPDASFFLSMVGDPLEEWVDGKEISVEDFRAVVSLEGCV